MRHETKVKKASKRNNASYGHPVSKGNGNSVGDSPSRRGAAKSPVPRMRGPTLARARNHACRCPLVSGFSLDAEAEGVLVVWLGSPLMCFFFRVMGLLHSGMTDPRSEA